MRAAKVMDVIATLPGCTGKAADTESGYTQVTNGGRLNTIETSTVRMSRYLDTSPTWVAQIFVKHRKLCGFSWTKSVWSPTCKLRVGKTIWKVLLGPLFPPEIVLSLTIFTAHLYYGSCFSERVCPCALFDLELSCVDFLAQFQWLVEGLVFAKMFTHHGVPVLHFGHAVSLFRQLLLTFCIFVPTVCAAVIVNFRFGSFFWISRSFSDFSDLFNQRYEAVWGPSLLENLFESSFGHSSLVVWVTHHICKRLCLFRPWHCNTLLVFFGHSLCDLWDFSQLSRLHWFLLFWLVAWGFPRRVAIESASLCWWCFSFFRLCCREPFCSVLEGQASFHPITSKSQTLNHDASSNGGAACTSGRDFDPVAKTNERYTPFLPWSCPKPPAQVLLISENHHSLKTQYGAETVRSLSHSLCEKKNPDCCQPRRHIKITCSCSVLGHRSSLRIIMAKRWKECCTSASLQRIDTLRPSCNEDVDRLPVAVPSHW